MTDQQQGDGDLIARVYPADKPEDNNGVSLKTIKKILARLQRLESLDSNPESPCLELTFNNGPRTKHGFVFGTHETCDIVLPPLTGISARHCSLTFEKQFSHSGNYRLVLRDFSTHETMVSFNKGGVKRKHSRWILDWVDSADHHVDIFVEIIPSLRFRIVVGRHDIAAPEYITRVEGFLRGTESPEEILMNFHLDTIRGNTSLPDAQTFALNPAVYKIRRFPNSGYGHCIVHQLFDIESGASYAGKEIIQNDRAKELEMIVMALRAVKHERMLQYISYAHSAAGGFMLVTELCFYGNILQTAEQLPLSRIEIVAGIGQIAEGLAYLHGTLGAPHGVLKPSNVLVRRRNPLHLVLSDMNGAVNKEWQHRPHYRAPEAFEDMGPSKNTMLAGDIWAMGAIAVHLALGEMPKMTDPFQYPKHLVRQVVEGPRSRLRTEWDELRLVIG